MTSGIKGIPQATCHPELKHFCKGLCKPCWRKEYGNKLVSEYRKSNPEARKEGDALYRLENKEAINQRSATWRENNIELQRALVRASSTFKRFGITQKQYDDKLASQNNLCALCGKEFYGEYLGGGDPVLDHRHEGGKLRGFLHRICNTALGQFKDDPAICRMAANYLEKYMEI